MAAQVQITNVNSGGNSIYVTFNVALSGSYVTGGDPLNFTSGGTLPAIADPTFVGLLAGVESCINIDVWSMGGNSISAGNQTLYSIAVTKSGTPSTINPQTGMKLKVAALASPSTQAEHGATSYESQYLTDVVTGMAVFTKLL